jgi:hypothetical protein
MLETQLKCHNQHINLTLIESMYLFHFIECIFFRKMSQSANSDSTAYEEDWICLTCNKVAVDHLSLETELLSETVVILIESNGTRWLKCLSLFHYHVTVLPMTALPIYFHEKIY